MARLVLLLALLAAPLCRAGPPALRIVAGPGTCPAPDELAAALQRALPGVRMQPDGQAVTLHDLGPRYRVEVAGAAREFADEQRACAERARTAAVFVAVTLQPPWIVLPEAAPPAPLVPTPAPPLPRPRPPALHVDLSTGGTVAVAPRPGRGENSPVTGGGQVRLALTWRLLHASLGVAGLSPAMLEFAAGRAALLRVPLDLSAGVALRRARFEADLEAGVLFTMLLLSGLDLPQAEQAIRLDAGLRLAGQLLVWVHPRVAPLVGLEVLLSPRPYDLVVLPQGTIGQTPLAWLAAAAGLVIRLR